MRLLPSLCVYLFGKLGGADGLCGADTGAGETVALCFFAEVEDLTFAIGTEELVINFGEAVFVAATCADLASGLADGTEDAGDFVGDVEVTAFGCCGRDKLKAAWQASWESPANVSAMYCLIIGPATVAIAPAIPLAKAGFFVIERTASAGGNESLVVMYQVTP